MPSKASHWLWIGVLILASLFWSSLSPVATAIEPSGLASQADVVIDGRPIFRLSQSEDYTAQERVEQANRQLPLLANLDQEPQVEVIESNQLPTIVANGQYLLTVTDLDAPPGKTPQEQAQEWVDHLEIALQRAQLEREPAYLRRAVGLSSLALLIAIALHRGLRYFLHRPLQRVLKRVIPQIAQTGMPDEHNFQFCMGLELSLLRLAVWIAALGYISSLFPNLRQGRYDLLSYSVTPLQS